MPKGLVSYMSKDRMAQTSVNIFKAMARQGIFSNIGLGITWTVGLTSESDLRSSLLGIPKRRV